MAISKQPRVVLCAEITADGKLLGDASTMKLTEGVTRVLIGGADAIRALFETQLVSEVWLKVHPRIDGRRGAPSLSGPGVADFFPSSVACRLLAMETSGDQCLLRYRVLKHRTKRTAVG